MLTLVSLALWPVFLVCTQALYDDDSGSGGWALTAWVTDSAAIVALVLVGLVGGAARVISKVSRRRRRTTGHTPPP